MSFDNLSFCKRVIHNIEPVLFEATQRCNWWEADYNEQAHVEITLTIHQKTDYAGTKWEALKHV